VQYLHRARKNVGSKFFTLMAFHGKRTLPAFLPKIGYKLLPTAKPVM
jgi:hypothetical protein